MKTFEEYYNKHLEGFRGLKIGPAEPLLLATKDMLNDQAKKIEELAKAQKESSTNIIKLTKVVGSLILKVKELKDMDIEYTCPKCDKTFDDVEECREHIENCNN